MFGLKTLMSVVEPVQRNSSVLWSTTVIFHLGHPKISQCVTAIVVNMQLQQTPLCSILLSSLALSKLFVFISTPHSILILQLQNNVTQYSLKQIHWRFRQGWWEL